MAGEGPLALVGAQHRPRRRGEARGDAADQHDPAGPGDRRGAAGGRTTVRMMPASSVESADVACAQLPDYDFPVGTSFETQPRIAVNGKTTRMFKTRAQWQCAALSHVVTGRDCV